MVFLYYIMKVKFFLFAFFPFVILLSSVRPAFASTFTEAFLRLDRLKTKTTLSGTVCAKVSSASMGNENKISLSFPADFTINTNTSNWTATTNDLPSGATAWPGIGSTAAAVSGQTVTWGSSDLTSSTSLYCFRFTTLSSSTGSSGQKTGTIATYADDTTLDEIAYALDILADDQITISGNIPPQSTDFQLDFKSSKPADPIGPDTMIEYTLTYGSYLSLGTSFTLEAEWSLGTIPGQNLYAFDIASYVAGGANRGYGNVVPTIDLARRKISWKIDNFPKKTTNQIVYFKLKTPDRFVSEQNVDFTVRARLRTEKITIPYKTVKQTYSPTQFIAKEKAALETLAIEVRQIDATAFSLVVRTSQPTKTTIYYGQTLDLEKSLIETSFHTQKIIMIEGLDPLTTYYFKIKVENEKGVTFTTPEIYTITTAAESLLSSLVQDSILLSIQGITLKNKASISNLNPPVSVPTKKGIDIFLPFKDDIPLQVFINLLSTQVLGINNLDPLPYLEKIRLLETEAGVFSGKIFTPQNLGVYDMILSATYEEGNVSQGTLAKIRVSEPIKITDEKGNPIEGARVFLEWFDPRNRLFEYFPAESFGLKNPAFSEADGSIDMLLPEGKYKIKVNALGFRQEEKEFVFSTTAPEGYPKISLTKTPFSPFSTVFYYYSIASDTIKFASYTLDKLASSNRFFDLSMLSGLFILSILSLLLTTHRMKIHLEDLWLFLEKYWRIISRQKINPDNLFAGFVEDKETGFPVHAASVTLVSTDNEGVISRALTSILGEFHLWAGKVEGFLLIRKKGFISFKTRLTPEILSSSHHLFQLQKEETPPTSSITSFFVAIFSSLFHAFSDFLLLTVFLFNLFLIWRVGVLKALPMTLVTLFNFILASEYSWKKWQERRSSLKKM